MNPTLRPQIGAVLLLWLAIAFAHDSAAELAHQTAPRVLLLVSGAAKDGGETRPGFEMDELSQAWNALQDNGATLGIASPQGGAVEADRFDPADPDNARFIEDARAQAALGNTLAITAINPSEWDAVFVIGGKGAMLDLAGNAQVGALLGRVHDDGGAIAAVCHGSAALAAARDAADQPLVAGRRVTGFSNEEEGQFAKRWRDLYPFLIEEELVEQGGLWSEAPLMLPHVVADNRLVTGQNPFSTVAVVDALLKQLGIVPRERQERADTLSLHLLQRAHAGDFESARRALAQSPTRYRADLIGIVGHYQLLAATSTEDLEMARIGLRLAEPYMRAEPRIQVSLADVEWRLGRHNEARQRLQAVMESHPQLREATDLWKSWSQ